MRKATIIRIALVALVNLALIMKMILITWNGNDKAIIAVALGYPALIFLNALFWIINRLNKNSAFKIYRVSTIILLILLIPVVEVACMF